MYDHTSFFVIYLCSGTDHVALIEKGIGRLLDFSFASDTPQLPRVCTVHSVLLCSPWILCKCRTLPTYLSRQPQHRLTLAVRLPLARDHK